MWDLKVMEMIVNRMWSDSRNASGNLINLTGSYFLIFSNWHLISQEKSEISAKLLVICGLQGYDQLQYDSRFKKDIERKISLS